MNSFMKIIIHVFYVLVILLLFKMFLKLSYYYFLSTLALSQKVYKHYSIVFLFKLVKMFKKNLMS